MKRATALRYCTEINKRLHEVNGNIPTPRGEFDLVHVSKVWVFGSTAKGSQTPRDLDLLIQLKEAGKRQTAEEVGFDPRYYRSYGMKVPRAARTEALMWLTKGMRGVSRHDYENERIEIHVKVEIYPVLGPLSP